MGKQTGFTLIELMVVIAVIGLLAAMAIPQYQNYVSKVRWQEAVVALDATRKATEECVQLRDSNPLMCNTDAAIGTTMPVTAVQGRIAIARGAFLGAVDGVGGQIVFVLANSDGTMGNCTVTATGVTHRSHIQWDFATSGAGCNKAKTGY